MSVTRNTPSVPSDLDIAQAARLRPILEIAQEMGLTEDDIEYYGRNMAKVRLEALEKLAERPNARYVDITAITPTPLGEGKSTTTVGLGQAFKHIGKRAIVTLRQPSQGPTFGIKGGAAGGGYSQVVPMEEFNLHMTGDIHAISAAHNLLSAMIDNHLHHGNELNINPWSISWRRVVDINDRSLRNIVIGLGAKADGVPRQSGFDITVASEVMAILALATSLRDLRERLGRIVVATTLDGKSVTAEDLRAAGAMTVLLKEALKPNLFQTLEGTPALVHCGPFANIAHGNCSILADMVAVKCGEYVITESGFGADMGAEKFFHIKCRYSGLRPNAAVLVATIRALKAHSGGYKIVPGRPLPPELLEENVADVEKGAANMVHHIRTVRKFGVNPVVALNRFSYDHDSEIEAARAIAEAEGARFAVCNHWAEGGRGAVDLAEAVVEACEQRNEFRFLYPLEASLKEKIETVAREVYGADGVEYSSTAERQLADFEARGFGELPICMAKTHLSLSHDPQLIGAPKGWRLPIREVRASVGAGFVYPLCGEMRTMPGLPRHPAAENVDIDEDGRVIGLF